MSCQISYCSDLLFRRYWKFNFFLRLAWNSLTMPTFWGFYGILIPWTIFLIETPKRHILGWSRIVWGTDRENRPPVFAVGNDKKKGKGRKGKVSHNLVLYFSYMGSGPPCTDFYENWLGWRSTRHNHSDQFWLQYFQGFPIYRGSISIFPLTFLVIVTTVLPLSRTDHWARHRLLPLWSYRSVG